MQQYRILGPNEIIELGDECGWSNGDPDWGEARRIGQQAGTEWRYRRLVNTKIYPEWRQPRAPGVPIHVLWAESPPGTPVVSQNAAESTPAALESISDPRPFGLQAASVFRIGDSWDDVHNGYHLRYVITEIEQAGPGRVAYRITVTYDPRNQKPNE